MPRYAIPLRSAPTMTSRTRPWRSSSAPGDRREQDARQDHRERDDAGERGRVVPIEREQQDGDVRHAARDPPDRHPEQDPGHRGHAEQGGIARIEHGVRHRRGSVSEARRRDSARPRSGPSDAPTSYRGRGRGYAGAVDGPDDPTGPRSGPLSASRARSAAGWYVRWTGLDQMAVRSPPVWLAAMRPDRQTARPASASP